MLRLNEGNTAYIWDASVSDGFPKIWLNLFSKFGELQSQNLISKMLFLTVIVKVIPITQIGSKDAASVGTKSWETN